MKEPANEAAYVKDGSCGPPYEKSRNDSSDTLTAHPLLQTLHARLGKNDEAVASPATTATKWKRVEGIFPPPYVARRLGRPHVGSD
jgi:hypothetical protein